MLCLSTDPLRKVVEFCCTRKQKRATQETEKGGQGLQREPYGQKGRGRDRTAALTDVNLQTIKREKSISNVVLLELGFIKAGRFQRNREG